MRTVENLWEISTAMRPRISSENRWDTWYSARASSVAVGSLDLAKSNVLTNKQVITHVILEDHADFTAQFLHVILAEVRSVRRDLPFGGGVDARQELGLGRASG